MYSYIHLRSAKDFTDSINCFLFYASAFICCNDIIAKPFHDVTLSLFRRLRWKLCSYKYCENLNINLRKSKGTTEHNGISDEHGNMFAFPFSFYNPGTIMEYIQN